MTVEPRACACGALSRFGVMLPQTRNRKPQQRSFTIT
jgi:hypothetical protein